MQLPDLQNQNPIRRWYLAVFTSAGGNYKKNERDRCITVKTGYSLVLGYQVPLSRFAEIQAP